MSFLLKARKMASMTNPNSLPESKKYYLRHLVLAPRVLQRLAHQAWGLGLVFYHSEVPFDRAQSYVRSLMSQGYRAQHAGSPEALPDSYLREMFRYAGASDAETDRYLRTLNPKRAHLFA